MINQADRVTFLAPVTAGTPQLVADVVQAARQWAEEADTMATLMGWSPRESSDLGLATLRLLDAVRTLQAHDAGPPDSAG